jgi:hypothetical protein
LLGNFACGKRNLKPEESDMGGVVTFLAVLGAGIAVALVIYWLFWLLWCAVMPAIWVGGPQNIVEPSFWLFVGVCILISFIGRQFFGDRSDKK